MLAATVTAVRDKFKDYCNKVVDEDEVLIITRKDERNVVMISMEEYNAMLKAKNNAEYLYLLDKSIDQMNNGKVISKTIEELEAMENE